MDPLNDPPVNKPSRPRPPRPTASHPPPPPLISKTFLQALGFVIGIGIAAVGFFVPWPMGAIFVGLGVIVVAVVAIATK